MPDTGSQAQSNSGEQRASERLDSWKEIAAYLRRDVRTVQRWERSEGLPVHRHLHDKQGTVYAYQSELETWWRGRQATSDSGVSVESAAVSGRGATAPAENPEPAWQAAHAHRRWLIPLALTVLLAAMAVYSIRKLGNSPAPGKVTVAVLPFDDLNAGDPEQQYFATGLSEEMMARLAQVSPGRLRVVKLTARYRDQSLRQIGNEFKADYVLEGSVRRAGERVAITGELLQIRDQSQVWADSYDRDLRDVLSIQAEVAGAIARAVSAQLPGATQHAPQVEPAAYEAYLKGRFF